METIQSETLKVDDVFTQHLFDSQGANVLPAGRPVSRELLRNLSRQNCRQVYFADAEHTPQKLLEPYNSSVIRKIEDAFDDTPQRLAELAIAMLAGRPTPAREIDAAVDHCLQAVTEDASAAMASALNVPPSESADQVLVRSTRLATMAMIGAQHMHCSPAECKAVGRAALLHDISLANSANSDELQYRMHPMKSVYLLRNGLIGITELELVLVAQVHEQCDGSGFPHGLKKHQLHPLSRLLNILDAFLSLTEPADERPAYNHADALAYLVLHALYGSFDRACVKSLVAAASIYPVGTQVVLSDNTTATIHRSNGDDYMQPVIRLDTGPGKYLDLRGDTAHILAPLAGPKRSRIPKSKLDQVLWQ